MGDEQLNGNTPGAAELELAGVHYRYPDAPRPVVNGFSLRLRRGETVCLLGPSGCGKSTILKLAGSFLRPLAGTIRFRGTEVSRPDPDRIVVFQDQDQLYPWKRTVENVAFPLRFTAPHMVKSVRTERASSALAEVELDGHGDKYPHQLSGGMKQRVALARAFVLEPAVLLLDEPFAAVDAPTREKLGLLLRRLQEAHAAAVLFVTHDVDEAVRLGDRVVVLGRNGEIRSEFTPEEGAGDFVGAVGATDSDGGVQGRPPASEIRRLLAKNENSS